MPSRAGRRLIRTEAALLLLAALGLSRPAQADESTLPGLPVQVGYDPERGTVIRTNDGKWEFNPYAMVQLQNITDVRDARVADTGFVLRSAKLIFHGHIFTKELTYHFQLNGGEGRFAMEDVYLKWDALPFLDLLAGQIEVPFNRQHITLEAYQQFVARSSVDMNFNLQRDLGLAAYLHTPERQGELTLGVWNGSRQNNFNDDASYMPTARLAWNPFGPIPFREADLEDTRPARVSLAAEGAYNPYRRFARTDRPTEFATLHQVAQGALEFTLRYHGLSVTSEAHLRRQAVGSGSAQDSHGIFGQVGYFLLPTHLEVVGRYGQSGGALAPDDITNEALGGVNYYFLGHRLKLQADGGVVRSERQGRWVQLRAQLEFFM